MQCAAVFRNVSVIIHLRTSGFGLNSDVILIEKRSKSWKFEFGNESQLLPPFRLHVILQNQSDACVSAIVIVIRK